MKTFSISRALGTFFLAAAVSACAAGTGTTGDPAAGGAGEGGATIVVDNGNTTYDNITVYLRPQSGARQRLGRVAIGQVQNYGIPSAAWGGEFSLLAEIPAGSDVSSRSFTMDMGDTVTWDLGANTITIR